ncbi:MAG TPA: hypothetical protein PLU36_01100, partial [Chitinophagaceae bacterium]|nr:hypothetical protein [Chitinophagaceae bacterium]
IPKEIKRWYHRKDSIRVAKEKEKEKEMEQREDITPDSTTNIKNTFDPEAEPNRKENDKNNNPSTLDQPPLLLHNTEKKKKKDSIKP